MKKSFIIILFFALFFIVSNAMAKPELSFYLGKKDGSANSDGVTVIVIIEEGKGKATEVFNQHWKDLFWSDKFVVDLSNWSNKTITLNMTTDPGPARNTGWDWIIIGDAKITDGNQMILDIGQAVASGQAKLSLLIDGEKAEMEGLAFGANCTPDPGPCGGETKPKSFMQHPAWDGKVGNTIARYEVQITAVDSVGKLATSWGKIKREITN